MMNYRIDPANGALTLQHRDTQVLSIPAGGTFAISHDGPILMKHGPAARVQEHADKLRAALRMFRADAGPDGDTPFGEVQIIEIPVSRLTADAIEEINACLAISGRVEGLVGRLGQLAATNLADAMPELDPAP